MQREKPSLRQLEYFLAVADSGSFRRAADRLGVSQPTLTAQVAALENLLDVRLFERSRAGTQLAPVGRELLANARRIVEEVDGFVDAADSVRNGPGGTYRLATTPTLGPYLLPHLLPDLHRRYAHLRLYIREGAQRELERGLAEGRYDLVLCPMPLDSSDFVVTPLFREPVKLVVHEDHELARKPSIVAADLLRADILTIEEHYRFFDQVDQLCRRLGARLSRDYQGTSLDALRHMVVMGMGHAFLPALYVMSEIHEQSQLVVTEIADEPVVRAHALVWRAASPSRAFFQRLAGDLREILARRLPDALTPIE
ncbi:MAG: hydrogen peroxide-inducible genes activator [Gammaproteobacteria bacterium]|nr:hydrogen peroxide-inducible genes activator [Gammaproteobacteria bacterium]MCP5199991.1 hydrogen peroxide-inducible genes activator [Gammaproteobacteria bacterium]